MTLPASASDRRLVLPRPRHGFTLVELVTSMALFLGIIAIVMPFFRQQARSVDQQGALLEAVQSARFAATQIDQSLRIAGGDVGQPIIVQAAPMAIAFNVDLVSRVPGDARATYYNPDADSLATESWNPSRAAALPRGSKTYPAVQYTDGSGIRSAAETISYWLSRDMTSSRTDVYTLWRRANDRDSSVVARNIVVTDTVNGVFRYWRGSSVGTLTQIPTDSLPLFWDNAKRWADSIRVVDVSFTAIYRDARTNKEVSRTIATSTRISNAGLLQQRSCGTEPLPPDSATLAMVTDSLGVKQAVRFSWKASPEESSGERDVNTYVVMRQLDGTSDWETLVNVPAIGMASYYYDDFQMVAGTWKYGVLAQDCNPLNSTRISATISVTP